MNQTHLRSSVSATKSFVRASVHALLLLGCGAASTFAQTVLPRSDTQMTVPHTVDSAEHAKYKCPEAADAQAKAREAAKLSIQTSDKNALACAADLRYGLAIGSTDINANLDALTSLLSYIDHVRDLKVYELSQIDWPEYDLRLEHAQGLSTKLISAARKQWPSDARISILSAAIHRSLAGPTDPQITVSAVEQMKRAIGQDPNALHGLGQLLIGRSYLDLAPIFGGGATNAVPYLTKAHDEAPDDPRALRSLAEAYDELRRPDDALAALKSLADVKPRDSDLQLYADEWRMGQGLAVRLKSPELVNRFATERDALLKQHPHLLSRMVESVWGHGETDPLSGKPDYEVPKR